MLSKFTMAFSKCLSSLLLTRGGTPEKSKLAVVQKLIFLSLIVILDEKAVPIILGKGL